MTTICGWRQWATAPGWRRDEGGNFSEWKNSERCCYGRQRRRQMCMSAAFEGKKNFQYRVSSQSPLAPYTHSLIEERSSSVASPGTFLQVCSRSYSTCLAFFLLLILCGGPTDALQDALAQNHMSTMLACLHVPLCLCVEIVCMHLRVVSLLWVRGQLLLRLFV